MKSKVLFTHTIEAAEALGYGSRDYELIEIES